MMIVVGVVPVLIVVFLRIMMRCALFFFDIFYTRRALLRFASPGGLPLTWTLSPIVHRITGFFFYHFSHGCPLILSALCDEEYTAR